MVEDRINIFVEKYRLYLIRIWNARKPLLVFNVSVAILAILYLLIFVKPIYECSITILPEYGGKNILGGIGQLASLAGINVGAESPMEIYRNLLFSESVLEPVIEKKYKTREYEDSVNLVQYFEIEPNVSGPDIDPQRAKFVKFYKIFSERFLKTDYEVLTKILTIKITMPERKLAVDVVNGVVNSLDAYIRTIRKSNASNQRFYLEKRISTVKDSLARSEENLKNFRMGNTVVTQSPNIILTQDRLVRNVEIFNTVYIELTRQLELAKLEEIRDSPVLNVKEFARDPIEKSGPNRRLMFVLILFLSAAGSVLYIAFKDDARKALDKLQTIRNILLDQGK